MMKKVFIKINEKMKRLFKYKEMSLLDIIREEKRNEDPQINKILKHRKTPLWTASVSSFLRILFLMGLFAIVANIDFIFNSVLLPIHKILLNIQYYYAVLYPILHKIRTFFDISIPSFATSSDLIAIHAGIGAILIQLAFFVAESLNDKNEPEKGRVLLYKSYFFPLLASEVLAFIFFFFGKPNYVALIPIIAIAGGTIYSLGQVINVLVHAHKMEEAKMKVLLNITQELFVRILDKEITKRIWANNLLKYYENSELLNFSPFGFFGQKKDIISIKSKETGFIRIINTKELEKLVSELVRALPEGKTDIDTNHTTKEIWGTKKEPLCYMCKSLNDEVKVDESLFEVNKKAVEKIGIGKITRMVKSIFKIEKDETEAEARVEISRLKDRCITAIKEQSTGELEKIMRLYVELIKEFFKYLNIYGGGFSSEQARNELGSFSGLKPLEWISKDIWEVFERGIDSEDINIIRDVAYLPILLAQQAIENRDHLVFQKFIYFPQELYKKGFEFAKKGNAEAAKIMFDRTWRYLKELSVYHLESKLKDDEYPEKDFRDYSIQILKIFLGLLKASFDKRDIENFEKFLDVVLGLFDNIDRSYNRTLRANTDAVYQELEKKRQEMLFGITSWIFSILKVNSSNANVKRFFDVANSKLPNKIEELTDTFLRVHEFKVGDDEWGWSWWEARPDEGVHTINTSAKFEQLFVIKSLSILRSKTDTEIQAINLPHNRDLAFLAEGTGDAVKTIEDIEKNPDNWKFVLDDSAINKCSVLRELFKKAHEQQEQDDLKRKRDTRISDEKILKFKDSFVTNFQQSHPIKTVLKNQGLYEDRTDKQYSGGIKKMGINTMFDKVPFFSDEVSWHIHFIGIDEAFGFGRSMAYGENEQILQKLSEKCERINRENFEATVASIKTSNLLLIATNHAIWRFFERSENYIPNWNPNFPRDKSFEGAEGVIRLGKGFAPVYQVFTPKAEKSEILILDKTKIGKVIQHSPLDKKDNDEYRHNIFLISIKEFIADSDPMNEFLTNPPPWLKELGTVDKQKDYLMERVLINIYERYEFRISPKFKGFILTVNDHE